MYAGRNGRGSARGYEISVTVQPDELRAAEKLEALAKLAESFSEPTYVAGNLRTMASEIVQDLSRP